MPGASTGLCFWGAGRSRLVSAGRLSDFADSRAGSAGCDRWGKVVMESSRARSVRRKEHGRPLCDRRPRHPYAGAPSLHESVPRTLRHRRGRTPRPVPRSGQPAGQWQQAAPASDDAGVAGVQLRDRHICQPAHRAEHGKNVAARIFCADVYPYHETICAFRRRNRALFSSAFAQILEQAYNAQASEIESRLIVGQQVTQDTNDKHRHVPTVTAIRPGRLPR